MRVFLVCSGGMSSGMLAQSLMAEALKQGNTDFKIEAGNVEAIADKLAANGCDIILVAPQVGYKKANIEEQAAPHNVPVMVIEGRFYTPMGAPKLYPEIMAKVK